MHCVIAIFAETTENVCVKERHPLLKAINEPILRENWRTVRDGI